MNRHVRQFLVVAAALGWVCHASRATAATCDTSIVPWMRALHDVIYVPNNVNVLRGPHPLYVSNYFKNAKSDNSVLLGWEVRDCAGYHEIDLPVDVTLVSVGGLTNLAHYLDPIAGTPFVLTGTAQYHLAEGDPALYNRYKITPNVGTNDLVGYYHRQNYAFGPLFLHSSLPDGTQSQLYYRLTWPGLSTEPDFSRVRLETRRFPEPGSPDTTINTSILWFFLGGAAAWPGFDVGGDMSPFFDSYRALGFNTTTTHGGFDRRAGYSDDEVLAFSQQARDHDMLTMTIHSRFSRQLYGDLVSTNSTKPNGDPWEIGNPSEIDDTVHWVVDPNADDHDACPSYRDSDPDGPYTTEINTIVDEYAITGGSNFDQTDTETWNFGALRGFCQFYTAGDPPPPADCLEPNVAYFPCQRCRDAIIAITGNPTPSGPEAQAAIIQLGNGIQRDIRNALVAKANQNQWDPPSVGAYQTNPSDFVYRYTFSYQHLRTPSTSPGMDWDTGADLQDSVPARYDGSSTGEAIWNQMSEWRQKPHSDTVQLWTTEGMLTLGAPFEPVLANSYDTTLGFYGHGGKGLGWFGHIGFEASDFYYFAKAMESINPVSDFLGIAQPVAVSLDDPRMAVAVVGANVTSSTDSQFLVVLRSHEESWKQGSVTLTFPADSAISGDVWDLANHRKLPGAISGLDITLPTDPGTDHARTHAFYVGANPLYTAAAPLDVSISPPGHAVERGTPFSRRTYSIAITNNDSPGELSASLSLVLSNVPAGWTTSMTPASGQLVLVPGDTGIATLTIEPPTSNLELGSHPFTIEVSDSAYPDPDDDPHRTWLTGRYEIVDTLAAQSGLITRWNFDSDASDSAPSGAFVDDAELREDAAVIASDPERRNVLIVDGLGDHVRLPDSDDLTNLADLRKRTASLWFKTTDENPPPDTAQIIFEEGTGQTGFNVYLYNGELFVGGWNGSTVNEPGWGHPSWPYEYNGTFISSDQIEFHKWHHVAFVLDVWENPHTANPAVATKSLDTFAAYLDGRLLGRGVGARVSEHNFGEVSDAYTSSTLGAARWSTRLHGDDCEWGSCSESLHFTGRIDDVRIYDRVLSSAEIALLASDADDDGLLDEFETGTGVYVSEYDTGTNPLLGDSDADGFSDFEEVEAGSDPNNAYSTPENIPVVPSLAGWATIALCLCLVAGMALTRKRYRRA